MQDETNHGKWRYPRDWSRKYFIYFQLTLHRHSSLWILSKAVSELWPCCILRQRKGCLKDPFIIAAAYGKPEWISILGSPTYITGLLLLAFLFCVRVVRLCTAWTNTGWGRQRIFCYCYLYLTSWQQQKGSIFQSCQKSGENNASVLRVYTLAWLLCEFSQEAKSCTGKQINTLFLILIRKPKGQRKKRGVLCLGYSSTPQTESTRTQTVLLMSSLGFLGSRFQCWVWGLWVGSEPSERFPTLTPAALETDGCS